MYHHKIFKFEDVISVYHIRDELSSGGIITNVVPLGVTAVRLADIPDSQTASGLHVATSQQSLEMARQAHVDYEPDSKPFSPDELADGEPTVGTLEELRLSGIALWRTLLDGRPIAEPARLTLAELCAVPIEYADAPYDEVTKVKTFVEYAGQPAELDAIESIRDSIPDPQPPDDVRTGMYA